MAIKRALIAGAIFLLLSVIAAAFYMYTKPRAGVDDVRADYVLSADSVYTEYETNEMMADKKYLNKIIQVTGAVQDVQITKEASIIMIGTSSPMGGISCRLAGTHAKDQLDDLKSKTITLKGKCAGFLMDVNLTDCILVKN